MAGKHRGVTLRKGKKGWWCTIVVNGRKKLYRCDSKTQAVALHGRLRAQIREETYFPKNEPIPFARLASGYEAIVDTTRRGRIGDDRARVRKWIEAFGDQDARTISSDQVERVLVTLGAEGCQPATLDRYFTVLKAS